MSTKEIAMDIVNALSEEQLKAFVTLFGSEFLQAKALEKLKKELDYGKSSGELIDEYDAVSRLGVEL